MLFEKRLLPVGWLKPWWKPIAIKAFLKQCLYFHHQHHQR